MDMSKTKKQLEKELETLNRSLKPGTVTIESVNDVKQIPTVSKLDMLNLMKKLHDLAQRAISHIPTDTKTTEPSSTSAMDSIMDMVKEELAKTLPNLVREGLASVETCPTKTVETETSPAVKHTLILEKITQSEEDEDSKITEDEWTTVVKKDVKETLDKVPVMRAGTNPSGTAKLHFKSKEDLAQAQEALQSKYKVTSKSEEPKMLNPKITISGLDSDITSKKVLESNILSKNVQIKKLKDDGEEFKIVFFDEADRFAVLQVSPAIRAALKIAGDKLCLGLEMYHVKDRYHVIQCYHCQCYGHTSGSPYCKSKDSDPTCFYCAGSHKSKDCTKKKDKKTEDIKCSNCCNSKNRTEKMKAGTHKASDSLCPFYIREKLKVMSRTHSSEEPKNSYQIRVKELLKKYGRV